jgi:hypothetical protein
VTHVDFVAQECAQFVHGSSGRCREGRPATEPRAPCPGAADRPAPGHGCRGG